MPEVRAADPPEEGDGPDAGKEGDPEANAFEMRLRGGADPDILRRGR